MRGWNFDVASIGFPRRCATGRIIRDPKHLGKGWVRLQFCEGAQDTCARGQRRSDASARQLPWRANAFLGLGTGLGSALLWDKTLMPLELGDLPYADGHIIENYLGIPGLELLGREKWKREVAYAVTQLKKSFIADYVVLGGGLVHRFSRLPRGIERGRNENALPGGIRLWKPQEIRAN